MPPAPLRLRTVFHEDSRLSIRKTLSIKLYHRPPFTPVSKAANIASVHTLRSTHDHRSSNPRSSASLACLGVFSTFASSFRFVCSSAIYLPASLRSIPITGLHRYYEGSDSHASHLGAWVSLCPVLCLPDHSDSNHPMTSCHRFYTLPLSVTGFWSDNVFLRCRQSGLRQLLAGSPLHLAELSSRGFRTDRSPSVASHPILR